MPRLCFAMFLLFAAATLSSCATKYHVNRDDISQETIWPYARGDISGRGAREPATFSGKLTVLWEASSSGKTAGPLTIYNNTLIYPETKKKIRFFDLETGRQRGRIKTKAPAQTGMVMADSLAFFAVSPRRSRLYAYDLIRHKSLWTSRVKDATPGPIIVGDRLLVGSREGALFAYALNDGHLDWKFESEDRFTAALSSADGRLFQPANDGLLYALSADDGREMYRVSLKGPIVSSVAVAENVYVTDMLGRVYALEKGDGTVIWDTKLDGPIWTSPAVAHGRVYVGHSGGEVVALDAGSGRELWRYETIDVVKASPLVIGDYVVVGTLAGRVLVLRADDGSLSDSKELTGAIAFAPVTDGKRLFVATQKGKIVCFGENNEPLNHAHQGIDPRRQPQ